MAEEALFSFVLESLGELLIEQGKFLVGVQDQVGELEQQLKSMRWFLRDGATNQEGHNSRVLEWVIRVRDLAYESENVIETYALKVKSPRGGGVTRKIKRFACILNECYLRHQIGSDIECLLKRITSLTNNLRDYGIREIMENKDDGSSSQPLLRRTYSTVNPHTDLFVGSENDINILAESIVGEEYHTISICGMGGIGKTTLARKVYHHSLVRSHFDIFLWISISQQWEKKDVLYRILVRLLPDEREIREAIENWTEEERVREIFSIIQTRKCLIVLDDIWSADVWGSIEPALPIGNKGSKVMVTTRNGEVAKSIDAHGYIHRPRLLNEDESWELLSKKALQRHQDGPETLSMEELGKEMVDSCGGLPLAVVVLGGILASKSSYEDWKAVHKSVKSYLRKGKDIGDNQGDLHRILALSYNDLPYQLKPCFLYLSKYAEDQEIEAATLYQIWMAEGMILSKDKIAEEETMMDVGDRYLGELVERCMVFVEVEEVALFRKFKSCQLHDLMRDLCISKAKEENFLMVNGASSSSSVTSTTTSRLAIYLTDGERVTRPTKEVARCLRSFSFVTNENGYKGRMLMFDDFVMLRVLILEGLVSSEDTDSVTKLCGLFKDHIKVSSSIGELIHLRYLSLRDSNFIILSSAVSNLSQLETLDLRGKQFEIAWISNVIWKLRCLKHLFLPDFVRLRTMAARSLVGRTFDLFLLRLDGLKKLEILDGFNEEYCVTKHLSTLTNLRSLTAHLYNGLQEFVNQVSNLKRLQSLKIEIPELTRTSEKVPSSLLEDIFCMASLEHLDFEGDIRALPKFRDNFGQNLLSLRLSSYSVETHPLSTLEKLQNLRRLDLELCYHRIREGKMTCHAMGFPKLKSFSICGDFLETWAIEEGAMPNLSHLTISGCEELKMIPDGLRFLTSLKELVIAKMPAEFVVKRIQVNADGEEGEDFHKIRHIHKVVIKKQALPRF